MTGSKFLQVPTAAVMTNRIVWSSMIIGQIAFAIVIVALIKNRSLHPMNVPANILLLVDGAMLAGGLAVAIITPRRILKADTDETNLVQRFGLANIIPMACLEGPSFVGLIVVILTAHWWPAGLVPAIAIFAQLLRFPKSKVAIS